MSRNGLFNGSEERALPAAWQWCSVGDIARGIDYGHTASAIVNASGPRFLRITDITPQGVDWNSVPGCDIDADDIARCRLQRDDLLFARIGSVGKSFLIRDCPAAVFASYLIRVRLADGFEPRFVLAYFQSTEYWSQITEVQQGIGRPVVNGTKLAALRVPIAPFAEQQRIADRIDELFTDLAAGVAALERVRRNLARYRAAVLHAAVTGRLTHAGSAEWAQAEKWQPLAGIIGDIEQGWSPKCDRAPASDDTEWAVMTTTAIQKLAFDGRENKRLPATLNPVPQYEVRAGDMLVTRAGPRSRCGIACLVRQTRPRLILCDKAYRFRCKEAAVVPEYLELVLNARPITDAIERMKTGSSDSGLNLTQSRFRSLLLPVPSKPVQSAIVEAGNEKLSQIEALESEVARGLARASRLRQAILKAAFEGRLVPQDPDDQPASLLVERIRSEAVPHRPRARSTRRAATGGPLR